MQVAAGTRLGPYEIVAPLGAGGMGEVWRARDTRLDRSVAIKILPPNYSANAALKARFEREAKAISQLNHPNICSLFDVGHENGTDFLVMELIDGETLAGRLSRGPLPLLSLIRYGAEIAEALASAHRSGVIHRDLKPQNVMITKSGAKLLDFGLAKASGVMTAPSAADAAEVATLQRSLTQEGTIVGTFQYMSPEQLEGHAVDHRSDLFALGAVLYEMATGRRAFDGRTRTSVIAAIVSSEPTPISQLQPLTPPALEQLIRGCIAKDPDARVQSAHDVALQLRWIGESPETARRKTKRPWLPWAVAGLLGLMLAGALAFARRPHELPRPVRLVIPAPRDTVIEGVPAVSPDGRQIVFRTFSFDGGWSLWLRSLDSLEARPLKGTEGASFAFWSPDGRNIGFVARGKMWRLDLADGTIRTIYEPMEDPPGGATWNAGDVIVFAASVEGGLLRVSAAGGAAVPVMAGHHRWATWPWFLPDGEHFLYVGEGGGLKPNGIYAGSLVSGQKPKLILSGPTARAAYGSGTLFSMRGFSLYAQKFDAAKLELRGEPEKIDDDVEKYAPGRAAFSVSEAGTLVYRPSGPPTVSQLMIVDRAGHKTGTIGEPIPTDDFALSPDERRVAFTKSSDAPSIWILEIARGTITRAFFQNWAVKPVWMPDGRSLVYSAAFHGAPNVYLRRGEGSVERLINNEQQSYPTAVSSDGRYVIASMNDPRTNFDVSAISIAGPHQVIPIVHSTFREEEGVLSPDDRWLAYTSNESGTKQIYAVTFPGGGNRIQISTAGGVVGRWSHDGHELDYFEPSSKRLMAVQIESLNGELRPSIPVALFPLGSPPYDVTRDGHFVIAEERLNPSAPGLTAVVNWRAAK